MSHDLRRQKILDEQERDRRRAEQKLFASAVRAVAATPEGKRVLAWIIGESDLFSEEFAPSSNNALNCGKAIIGKKIWKALMEHADRSDFIAIILAPANALDFSNALLAHHDGGLMSFIGEHNEKRE